MNETIPTLPPELNAALSTFFYAEQTPDTDFAARLEKQLLQRQSKLRSSETKTHPSPLGNHRSIWTTMRTRPILAIITVLLTLLCLTGIVYAVAHLAGFIPGIGFVKDVQSVLATPVSVERQIDPTPIAGLASDAITPDSSTPIASQSRKGITVTIEQAVAEADRLVVAYKVTGLPADFWEPKPIQESSGGEPEEPPVDEVHLPDGTDLKFLGGGGCGGASDMVTSWLSCKLIFSPLPEGVNEFTLEIHRLEMASPGELPENWQIPISMTPVNAASIASNVQEPDLSSQTVNGITLQLLKVSQGPTQTAFQFGIKWQGQDRFVHHTAPITLQDELGRYYILSSGPDNGTISTLPSLITTPIATDQPLTFTLKWVIMAANGQANLHFDPGKDARLGQEWAMDEKINAGGFDLHFIKARLKNGSDGSIMLEFDIEAPEGVTGINLIPNAQSSTSEFGYDKVRGIMVSRVSLPAIPTGPIDLDVAEVFYKVSGPWQITWVPKKMDFSTASPPTPVPTRIAGPAATPFPNEPLLSDLQALLQRADTNNPSGPGWIHQVTDQDQTEVTGDLDTGDLLELPPHTRVDAWYLVDKNGYAQTTIYIRKTLDGKFLSADIYDGIYDFSLPEGRGSVGDSLYLEKPTFDSGLFSTMNGYLSEGGTIRRENTVLAGIPCQMYEVTLHYDPSQVFSDKEVPAKATIYSAWVNTASGKVMQIQGRTEYTNGITSVDETIQFVSLEKVDTLPEEPRQLLDSVILP